MNGFKTAFAVIFAVMTVMLTSTAVYAEVTGEGTPESPYVVENLADIKNCVNTDCYIKLGKDISFNSNGAEININGTDIHLDLNGHSLTDKTSTQSYHNTAYSMITILNSGCLTLNDSGNGGKLVNAQNAPTVSVGSINDKTKENVLIVNGGTINNNNTGRESSAKEFFSPAVQVYHGCAEINGGTFYSARYYGFYASRQNTVVINNGTFKSDAVKASNRHGVCIWYCPNFRIYGGDIYGLLVYSSTSEEKEVHLYECNIYDRFASEQSGTLSTFLAEDSTAAINGENADTSAAFLKLTDPLIIKGRQCIVTFYDSWSVKSEYLNVCTGRKLVLPECMLTAPEGKQFAYWSLNGTEYNVGDGVTITADTQFIAVWETKQCKVTFNTNGIGTAPAAQTVLYGGHPSRPSVPDVNDYYVSGWYKDKECTQEFSFVNSSDAVKDDITLYAKWVKKDGTIVFSLTEEKTAAVYYGDDIKITAPQIDNATNLFARVYYYDKAAGKDKGIIIENAKFDALPIVFSADSDIYKNYISPENNGTYLNASYWYKGINQQYYKNVYLTVKYKNGDFNKNGKLDEEDAAMLLKHLSGSTQLDEEQYARADVNGDGNKDMLDVISICTLSELNGNE
ncbi:MAG: InlB B-repeat-containing protein [Firmicutes bacterium]|nr:InlB B-repeat-containing protein [Bacillota bacterium]